MYLNSFGLAESVSEFCKLIAHFRNVCKLLLFSRNEKRALPILVLCVVGCFVSVDVFLCMYSEDLAPVRQAEQCKQIWKFHCKKITFTNGCFDIIHAGHIR